MKRPFITLFSNIPFVLLQTFLAGIVLGIVLSYSSFGFASSSISNSGLMNANIHPIKKSQNLIEKIQTLVRY